MEKANWVALKKTLGAGLIVCHLASFANGQTSGQGVAANLTGEVTEQHVVGEYLIRLRATLAEPGTQPVPNRMEILRAGDLVHYQVGSYLSIGCTDAEIPLGSRLKVGQDVTGADEPEIVIQDEQFNPSGTSDWYVFALGHNFRLAASVLHVITEKAGVPSETSMVMACRSSLFSTRRLRDSTVRTRKRPIRRLS